MIPDFGYDCDNFLLENTDAPRNWQLMTGLLSGKNKHEWLRTHIALRRINQEREKANKRQIDLKIQLQKASLLKNMTEESTVLKPGLITGLESLANEVAM